MQGITTIQTWREMLGEIIRDPRERERLAGELGVNPVTLVRWSTNTSSPRLSELRALLRVLPNKQALLSELLGSDPSDFFSDGVFSQEMTRHPVEERRELVIPSRFYADALRTARHAPERFWTMCSLILGQMLAQLDPERQGIEIIVAQCMPPREGKVRSLRERVGQGTPPWLNSSPEEKNLFLGAESLAGYAVAHGHRVATPGVWGQGNLLPFKEASYEVSLAAFPIMLEGNIAGCLVIASTQAGYFTVERLQLLDDYADLIRLAFCDADYYPQSSIELGIMPSWEVQQQYFASFRERITGLLREASLSGKLLDALTAEQIVRQQLEEELLKLHCANEAVTAGFRHI